MLNHGVWIKKVPGTMVRTDPHSIQIRSKQVLFCCDACCSTASPTNTLVTLDETSIPTCFFAGKHWCHCAVDNTSRKEQEAACQVLSVSNWTIRNSMKTLNMYQWYLNAPTSYSFFLNDTKSGDSCLARGGRRPTNFRVGVPVPVTRQRPKVDVARSRSTCAPKLRQ